MRGEREREREREKERESSHQVNYNIIKFFYDPFINFIFNQF